ncbi:hypothetical protein QBC47DRAFT_49004 [Echria macrotheca]|uniref:Uncharacterized protein n=1 Tax=Echria macrotheca TaxID=438768 RepID=A0AAJ0BBH7_9PEZI|nr:hypothetical protein QBC47DRAFT_49004 [Echria macrotheca]
MSGAGRRALTEIRRAVERWPHDALRPDCQLQTVLAKRLEAGSIAPASAASQSAGAREDAERKQANALFALVENRYITRHRLSDRMMKPKFNPTYYEDLLAEIEEAPNRSWTARISKKLRGMFRLK